MEVAQALAQAALKGDAVTLERLLLEENADVNATDEYGATALIKAATYGHERCVEVLLRYGADPNLEDCNGCTALHVAALKGHAACIEMLVHDDRVDVNHAAKENGDTALFAAVFYQYPICVHLLVNVGRARLDQANNDGWTPLHVAALRGHAGIVALLLDAGADHTRTTTKDCQTALQIAEACSHDDCADLIYAKANTVHKRVRVPPGSGKTFADLRRHLQQDHDSTFSSFSLSLAGSSRPLTIDLEDEERLLVATDLEHVDLLLNCR